MNSILQTDPLRRRFVPRRIKPGVTIAKKTGPLNVLVGQRLLVLADIQNIDCGARDLGYRPSYGALARTLSTVAHSASLHAIFARHGHDDRRWRAFTAAGWIPHAKMARLTSRGTSGRPDANIDHLLAFMAGLLAGLVSTDVVVLVSGDGQLVLDVAEGISQLPRPKPVVTLSLAGSTSYRIDARKCSLIRSNLELGKDCLHRPAHCAPHGIYAGGGLTRLMMPVVTPY